MVNEWRGQRTICRFPGMEFQSPVLVMSAFTPLGHLTSPCVSFLMLILPSHFSICAAKAGTQVVLNKREIRCLRKECWLLTNLGSCKLFLNVFQVDAERLANATFSNKLCPLRGSTQLEILLPCWLFLPPAESCLQRRQITHE